MTHTVIDGRKIAESRKDELVEDCRRLRADGIACGLATVLVGDRYSSHAYERRLARLAAELGVTYRPVVLDGASTQQQVTAVIDRLNADPEISGILVLRPLPPHISETDVIRRLAPVKDIESVHPHNAGLLALGTPRYVPSTAAAAFHVLDSWLDYAGEDRADFYHRSLIVVVGRSNNVGKPAVSLAYDRQAAVESIDEYASRNNRLGWHTRRADVLIVAAGVPGLIRAEHVRAGAVVLDVGINPVLDPATGRHRLVGDVAYDEVAPRTRAITPVPGGIGPVTDVWLLRSTLAAARALAAEPAQDGPGQ